MIDQYAKTLVIDDPDYAPGSIVPPSSPNDAPKNEAPPAPPTPSHDTVDNDADLPSFEDTSWLT